MRHKNNTLKEMWVAMWTLLNIGYTECEGTISTLWLSTHNTSLLWLTSSISWFVFFYSHIHVRSMLYLIILMRRSGSDWLRRQLIRILIECSSSNTNCKHHPSVWRPRDLSLRLKSTVRCDLCICGVVWSKNNSCSRLSGLWRPWTCCPGPGSL